jgi:hypothetical protein
MTAFVGIRDYLGVELFRDSEITLFDIGCGKRPRSALLFAHMTKWQCVAIDPVIVDRSYKTKRITLHNKKIEDCYFKLDNLAVIVAVHAHFDLEYILKNIHAPRYVILAIPCCVPLKLNSYKVLKEYEDLACISPKRNVKIYDIS